MRFDGFFGRRRHQERSMNRFTRYSLRTIFLLVSAAAVVCWYYWRRPFEVEVVIADRADVPIVEDLGIWETKNPFVINGDVDPFGPQAHLRGYYRREVRSVRRNGFQGVVREGPTTAYTRSGRKVYQQHWRGGRRQGPFTWWDADSSLRVQGQFHQGRRDGCWYLYNRAGELQIQQEFAGGEPHGMRVEYLLTDWSAARISQQTTFEHGVPIRDVCYLYAEDGSRETHWADYEEGTTVRIDGVAVTEFTRRFESAPAWLRGHLDLVSLFESDRDSLESMIWQMWMGRLLGTPVAVDPSAHSQWYYGISPEDWEALNDAPLRIALPLLLRRHGLVCDYRFEQIVITTPQEAKAWEDRTGVDALQPPPDSELAKLLETETGVEICTSAHLKEALGDVVTLAAGLADAESGASQVTSIYSVRRPLRHWLHRYLGRAGLRCELAGDKLLVSRQTEDSPL